MHFQHEILGGVLIGAGSAIPLLFEARIAGISGYAESAMRPGSKQGRNAVVFLLGLVLSGLLWRLFGQTLPDPQHNLIPPYPWPIAGFLVGFGARLSGGCTSGHGVCGLGRASPRSLVAVIVFMSVAMITTFILSAWL